MISTNQNLPLHRNVDTASVSSVPFVCEELRVEITQVAAVAVAWLEALEVRP